MWDYNPPNTRPQYWPYYTVYGPEDGFENDRLPYDYTSILHATSQVRPDVVIDVTKPAVTRNDGLNDLGQRSYLTDLDVQRITDRYSCEVCSKPGSDDVLYEYPGDCTKFIQCSNGQEFVMQCPDDLHFSVQQQQCLYPGDAKCTIYYSTL
ncbi:astacin-like metalloendopeptidase [Hyalella azteca]|uniref:Astacin-like metalloendopeptidase n=1 Tax=Hyalella azteca TaxID=294128 RepID=A0A979FSB8_HYAAZ|nr:astacin-like metalloendopeptidase [Hyalella azteca]